VPVYQFKWYLFFQIEESEVPLEPPPQFVENKKIDQHKKHKVCKGPSND
jgi:hypothetical protein